MLCTLEIIPKCHASWIGSSFRSGRHCHLHGDMHVFTFDHQVYDFNGTCNYTVAQQGTSFTPPLGVFTWPKTCKGRSACFRHTTFKNDEHTVVTVNHYDLFKVMRLLASDD